MVKRVGRPAPSGGTPASGQRPDDAGVPSPDALDDPRTGVRAPATRRLFGSPAFFRLWLAQVVLSLGDWVGLLAITAIASRVGGSSSGAAVGLVLSARLLPGFFFAPVAGVAVDRWDRKKVMVACSVGRGVVLAFLPFVDTVWGLFAASLVLEVLTLLWGPAKEATVPNLVRPEFLANANSLSLVAAYGTFPLGSAVFALLTGVAKWLGRYESLEALRVSQETVAIWFYMGTAFVAAVMISALALPSASPRRGADGRAAAAGGPLAELREGLSFIGASPVVRAVMLGIATGLVGGGMVVPLGPSFAANVLGGGSAGFGLLMTALGFGVAAGIVVLSALQRRLPHERVFVGAVLGAGVCMLVGASVSSLTPAVVLVAGLGLCAGAVYVLGFTMLQTCVDDALRGRVFATLYTLVRLCLLLALVLAPLLSDLLDSLARRVADGGIELGSVSVALPGERLTLWLGGTIICAAGGLAAFLLRGNDTCEPTK